MTDRLIPNAALLSGWRKSSYSGSDGGDCLEVLDGWRKSSYSGSDGGNCLEVQDGNLAGVPVRDSKNPDGPAVVFPPTGWASFVTALKRGEFPAA